MKIITRKKTRPDGVKEHFTKLNDIWLLIIRFFFSQTNLVFIDILDSFCHCLFIFLPFDFWYSTYFRCSAEFIQCPYVFFIKASKVLNLKMFLFCLNFHEKFFPANGENNFWRWSFSVTCASHIDIYARSLFCKQIFKRNINDCNELFYVWTYSPPNLLSFFPNSTQFLCSDNAFSMAITAIQHSYISTSGC